MMSEKIIEYKIVQSDKNNVNSFAVHIMALFNIGWELYGQPYATSCDGIDLHYQAMVRYEHNK